MLQFTDGYCYLERNDTRILKRGAAMSFSKIVLKNLSGGAGEKDESPQGDLVPGEISAKYLVTDNH
jgi:hypothetical protein